MKNTLPDKILSVLTRPMALHEIREAIQARYGEYHNDASISARTREMGGELESFREPGKPFKMWKPREMLTFDSSGQGDFIGRVA